MMQVMILMVTVLRRQNSTSVRARRLIEWCWTNVLDLGEVRAEIVFLEQKLFIEAAMNGALLPMLGRFSSHEKQLNGTPFNDWKDNIHTRAYLSRIRTNCMQCMDRPLSEEEVLSKQIVTELRTLNLFSGNGSLRQLIRGWKARPEAAVREVVSHSIVDFRGNSKIKGEKIDVPDVPEGRKRNKLCPHCHRSSHTHLQCMVAFPSKRPAHMEAQGISTPAFRQQMNQENQKFLESKKQLA